MKSPRREAGGGFSFCVDSIDVAIYPRLERDRETQSNARRFPRAWLVSFSPSPIRRFHQQECRNVFVESCRALGARGNGRSLPAATPRSSRSRERRAHGEGRPASVVFHEQEVRRPRSGFAFVPHSLISQQVLRQRSHARRWADARNSGTPVGKPAGVIRWSPICPCNDMALVDCGMDM